MDISPVGATDCGHVVHTHQAIGLLCWHCAVMISSSRCSIQFIRLFPFITMH